MLCFGYCGRQRFDGRVKIRRIPVYLLDMSQPEHCAAELLLLFHWISPLAFALCYLCSYQAREGALVDFVIRNKMKAGRLGRSMRWSIYTGHSIYCVSL